ncbi:CoA protein activase [Acetivibrio mesophilus]|uniref:CoA protein activase n=1 Tax=Acetivibrio mesophilus TaxID=2487273 RepID=A0A4Q0I6Z2_9FIRM|nr:CoA protein activase [Acetivibrio mesophilus]ODM25799.1 CoA protein activase [Clostridium sp. Bc-iso-3]RXE59615.1 CoA protein activase [Acetivibrio mesophilus]HHV30490.1 CoA protein activase [Clostridium sp.]
MIITFPHMGNTYIAVKALLDDIGAEYVIPPLSSKRSLEIGTKYAPEMACLPLKINLGNFVEAYEKGANTILTAGGRGPCRFGYYCEMSREILQDNGYDMDVIVLEAPDGDIMKFVGKIKKLAGSLNIYRILKVIKNTTLVAKRVDELERLAFKIRPREIRRGSTDRIYESFRKKVVDVKGSQEILKLVEDTKNQLLKLEIDKDFKPMRIGIVGEIYTTIDSYSSFNIDSILGNMGVEVYRENTISGWIIEHMLKAVVPFAKDKRYAEAAKPYLGTMIGGHAQETIGNTILYAQSGFDGIIQIYPLTCMPEIVAESILPAVERDYNIPILTLIIDEMTGEAGYMTRIEAFVDLLNKRRERVEVVENLALFGD